MIESDLFPPVKTWLEDRDFTVYSEVTPGYGGRRADIVATRGPVLMVVELKTSLSLDLIGQCMRWEPFAHYVYACVPLPKRGYVGDGSMVLAQNGVGLLTVKFLEDYPVAVVNRVVAPKQNRNIMPHLRNALCDEQRTGVPGGHAGGGFSTPYSRTMDHVREHLRLARRWTGDERDGWMTVREILDAVETHYANPKSSLGTALMKFEADWCEKRQQDGKWMFRAKGTI